MIKPVNRQTPQMPSSSPLEPPVVDRKILRALSLMFALLMTVLYVRVCFAPLNGSIGFVHYHFSNPIKLLAVIVLALQVWWLLTRQASALVLNRVGMRWWQFKLSLEAIELCLAAALVMVATDLQWRIEPIIELLRPSFAIQLALLASGIVVLTMRQRWRRVFQVSARFRNLWRSWGWGSRLVCLVLVLHLAIVANMLSGYWDQTSSLFLAHESTQSTFVGANGRLICNFPNFCRTCAEQIPPDARILYHGGNEGLVLAFEVYPRRVFMLPQEQFAMFHECWKNELWCRGIAADPLNEKWKWDDSPSNIDAARFIEEHNITHVVTFDPLNAANCRVQQLR